MSLKLSPIKSSWLKGAHYDPETKLCTVEMKSGTYRGAVEPKVYEEFAKTFQAEDSSGKFFNAHLRKLVTNKL